jgi:hypothetical protein
MGDSTPSGGAQGVTAATVGAPLSADEASLKQLLDEAQGRYVFSPQEKETFVDWPVEKQSELKALMATYRAQSGQSAAQLETFRRIHPLLGALRRTAALAAKAKGQEERARASHQKELARAQVQGLASLGWDVKG